MTTIGAIKNAYRILVGGHLGKRPLGRPGMWEDNTKVEFSEIGSKGGKWMKMAESSCSVREFGSRIAQLNRLLLQCRLISIT